MTRRTDRVAETIRRLISEVVHNQLKDPRAAGFITITKVEVTPDLRLAKIFYSVLGNDKQKKRITGGLKSAKNFIRRYIADKLKMRYAPDILFKMDEALAHRERIDKILDTIHEREGRDETDRKSNKSDQEIQ